MNPNNNPYEFLNQNTGIQRIQPSNGVQTTYPMFQTGSFDTRSPQGLYEIASQAGLKDRADKMVQRSGGEQMEYLSGGFIMDSMDILNTLSYGMVGLAKGKGFIEGVKNRETFADDDSLGQYGFAGKVAGFFGDILLDPLTYVAPLKIVTKIPGMTQLAKAADNKLFGELTTMEIDGQKFFNREGGIGPLTFLQDKLIYGAAVDKKFVDGYQATVGRNDALISQAEDIVQAMGKLDNQTFQNTISFGDDGRLISTSIDDIRRMDISPEELSSIEDMYRMRDDLMNRLIDLGVISKETADEHWGTYLRQSYDEFIDAKEAGHHTRGMSLNSKKRVQGLTEEQMKELGQVTDPGVVWGSTLIKQIDLVKRAELQKFVNDGYALTEDQLQRMIAEHGEDIAENLHRVPEGASYGMPGRKADLTKSLAQIRKRLKDIIKQRKKAFKDDKEMTSYLNSLDNRIENLRAGTEKEMGQALSGLKEILRETSTITRGATKKKPTSQGQQVLATQVRQWLKRGSKTDVLERETRSTKDLWKDFKNTREGIAIQRAFNDPQKMYQWNSPEEFMDAIRYPDRAKVYKEATARTEEISEAAQDAAIKRAEKKAREVGKLTQEKQILEETNAKMIQDMVDKIEDEYADVLFERDEILKALEFNKNGALAGKYVDRNIWDMMKGNLEPEEELGQGVVMAFKKAKVIWNPASHVRNAFSATIQNWWKMGLGPWRADVYYDAALSLRKKDPIIKEMQEMGFNERSGYIRELLDNYIGNKDLTKKSLTRQLGSGNAVKRWYRKMDNAMMNSYAWSDNVAKVAAYKQNLKNGLSKQDAFNEAMAATFNYSQVTPFVHRMRKSIWGVPFITFALKAVPLTAETLAKNPQRISVFGKARNALFQSAGIEAEQEAETMPDWMRDDMFVMRLPWKDERGRSMYFDLSYIIPFGGLVDGSFLKDPISANPVLQTVRELSRNETFGGSKIFRETDDIEKVIADISIHVLKLGAPPAVTDALSDGYDSEGNKRDPKIGVAKWSNTNTNDLGANERTFYQESFRMLGFGALPYNATSRESALAYKQRENLTKLLTEEGIIKAFETSYLPKDSPLRGAGAQPGMTRDTTGNQWTIR